MQLPSWSHWPIVPIRRCQLDKTWRAARQGRQALQPCLAAMQHPTLQFSLQHRMHQGAFKRTCGVEEGAPWVAIALGLEAVSDAEE